MDRPMVEHVERRARRLSDMIVKLGVDRSRLARAACGNAFTTARANCLSCPSPSACLDWLDAAANAETVPPHFCPNYQLLLCYAANLVPSGAKV